MSLFRDKDIEQLDDKIDEIIKSADLQRLTKIHPTRDEMWGMLHIVRDYIIEKKRKIYGGFALNKLIEVVSPKDMFYDTNNVEDWDIDFYSPDPIGDAREIANRLYDKGYKYVTVNEAQHDETYKIYAETFDCADITYVPRNIYNRIPVKNVNGLHLTGPHFMMIDYFRVITDPLNSYHRLDKTVKRLSLMDKFYPLPHNTSPLDIIPAEKNLDIAFRTVHEFFKNRDTVVVLGSYAYDHYVLKSGIQDRSKTNAQTGGRNNNTHNAGADRNVKKATNIKLIPVNYYEAISTSYKKDARNLILKLRDKFLDDGKLVVYEESYPFFQYLGYSVTIMFDGYVICKLYHHNNRCTPYLSVPAHYFDDQTYTSDNKDSKSRIQIGSYPTIILYNLITIMKARTDNDKHTTDTYYKINSHLIEMKNWYLDNNNFTIYDDTMFKNFVVECRGESTSPMMDLQIRIQLKMASGGRYRFRYNPEKDRDTKEMYQFKNTSGNPIKNVKNHQIDLTISDIDIKNDRHSEIIRDVSSIETSDETNDETNSKIDDSYDSASELS